MPVINNFPILEMVLYALSYGAGLRHYIFGVKGTKHYVNLQSYFQGGSGWSAKLELKPNVHIEYQNPNYNDNGSADSTRYNIEKYGINEPVIVCPGDNLFFGEDIKNMYEQAINSPYDFTVGLTRVQDPSPYGLACIDESDNRITSFVEKPEIACDDGGLVSTGIYIIKPGVFPYLKHDFGKDVVPELTKLGKVGGYVFKKKWYDFGNPPEHLKNVLDLLENPTPCLGNFLSRVCTEYVNSHMRLWVRGRSRFSRARAQEIVAKVQEGKIKIEGNVFIGKDCVIEDGVSLSNCSVGDLSFIKSCSEISHSNILDAWQIGKNVKVSNSFLGRGGSISDNTVLDKQFIGDNSAL